MSTQHQSWHTYVFLILFFLILVGGAFLRFYKLGHQSLWIDEGYSINASQAVLDHGYPTLDSGENYTGHIFSTYIIAGSMQLFGFEPYSPWSARLPSVLFGIGVIFMTYMFAYRLTENRWVALGAMLFVAFLPWEIAWSRQARGYVMLQFFLLLTFDKLIYIIKSIHTDDFKNKLQHLGLLLLYAILGFLSHGIGIAFIIPIVILLGIVVYTQRKNSSPWLWMTTAIMGAYVLYRGIKYVFNVSLENYFSSYAHFLLQQYPLETVFTIVGIISMFFFAQKKINAVCITAGIGIPVIVLSLYTSIQMRYLVPLIPFLGSMISYGIYNTIDLSQKTFFPDFNRKHIIGCISMVGIILLLVLQPASFIPQSSYVLEPGSPQPPFADAYAYVQQNKHDTDLIISPYAHMTKIYLGEPELLIPISLTGKSDPGYLITKQGQDFYTGTKLIDGVSGIMNSIENNHGYIMIDSMARRRLGKLFTSITNHPKAQLVYETQFEKTKDTIWIYQF
ncbi:MAG: glycosyltransferase family 39 protein [Candidatus Pacebacteria bacterium]|nr:glycosyltransferase family 39 protein [Candidatus Paceibacterota bacterium]